VTSLGKIRPALCARLRIRAVFFPHFLRNLCVYGLGPRRVASRCVIEGSVKHLGIKYVGRRWLEIFLRRYTTQTTIGSVTSPLVSRVFLSEAPLTSISRFSRNVPYLPWHSTPSRYLSAAILLLALLLHPHPFASVPPFPTLFSRIRRSSWDLLPTILAAFLPRTATMLSSSFPVLLLRLFPHPTSVFLFHEASQFQTCQFWFISARSRIGYDLIRHAVRRIATLPGLERPSFLIRSRSLRPGHLDTSCSMVRDAHSIHASHEIPTSLKEDMVLTSRTAG